jgi:hypothetical protein
MDGLLTEQEVKSFLEVDSPEIERLKRRGKLTAYNVGGSFVRYRKDEVIAIRSGKKFRMPDQFDRSWFDTTRDFVKFYGLYMILTIAVAILIVYFLQP